LGTRYRRSLRVQSCFGKLAGIHPLVGSQGDAHALAAWKAESGGRFDIIVDDGSHKNGDIKVTFDALFNDALAPGGVYFIEDLHVGRSGSYMDANASMPNPVMADIIKDWVEQLAIWPSDALYVHKLPANVSFVMCQAEACAIGKNGGTGTYHTRATGGV